MAETRSADQEMFGLLLEVHARLTRELGRELEIEAGIPLAWYEVLHRLGRGPADGIRLNQLAQSLVLSSSGATRLVDRMEAAGLIQRVPACTDRRGFNAVLTEAGERALARATPVHLTGIERRLTALLEPEEQAALTSALRKLRGPAGPNSCD